MHIDHHLAPRKTPRSLKRFGLTKESFLEETDFDEVFFKSLIRKTRRRGMETTMS